ncbi:MAG: TetR/AcrR family transcriptional regulator [Novosphingobium sp.]
MRVKTDARRSVIVAAAWEAFRDNGFERTTMSDINARAGGSKATLYSYFASKDDLFAAALEYGLQESTQEPFRQLAGSGELAARLIRFARAYMDSRLLPDMIAIDRILIAEAGRSDVYAAVREKSYLKRRMIAGLIEPEMAAGRLRDADPIRAAIHLLALIEADVLDRHLHGDTTLTPQAIDEQVHQGVDTFLRAYAAD